MTDRSFSLRFALYALAALVLSAGVALPLARSNAHKRAVAQLHEQAEMLASILGPNFRPGQLDRPLTAAARRQLDVSLRHPELLFVKIVNRKGALVWSSRGDYSTDSTMDAEVRGAFAGRTADERTHVVRRGTPPIEAIEAATPIPVGGRVGGVLAVYHSWKPFATQIRHDTAIAAATIGLALLLVYLALIPILLRLLRDRRAAETKLRAREQVSQAIVEHASEGIWVLDADGVIESVNPKIEELLGYAASEMIGRPISDFSLVAPAERGRQELLLRRADGSLVWTLVATASLGDHGAAVATVVDIEDIKWTEKSLDGARRRLAAIVHAQRAIVECGGDLGAALEMVIAHTRDLTSANGAGIYFQEEDELVARATTGASIPLGDRIPLGESLAGLALRTGAVQVTQDSQNDDRVASSARRSGAPRSCVLVPLTQIAAVLVVVRERRNGFDDEAIETTRLMAEFASAALRNAEDAQEREQLVRDLAAGEERFRNAIESSPIGFALCTPADEYLVINDAYCKIVGRSWEELQLLTWRDLTHPDDLAVEEEPAERLVDGKVPHLELEKRLVRGDGETIWVRTLVSMVRDEHGQPMYGLAQMQDVTERRRLELAVREREEFFRTIFELSPLPKLMHGDNGRIIDANERAAELAGLERSELIGRHFSDFGVTPESLDGSWQRMLEEGSTEGEAEIRTPAGLRQVILSARANIQPGRHLITVQDVTEQRLLEERLRQAHKLEAVGQLAGGVAHDFNNMLTAISGFAQLLIGRPDLDADVKAYVGQIEQASQRAAALTRQLLALSSQQVLQPSLLDLNALVHRMRDAITRVIGERVTLELALDPVVAPALADASQLRQVVINLAENARDAMPSGGALRIGTSAIVVSGDDPAAPVPVGRYTVLTIADTGVGMTPELLERAFEPFYSTKREAGFGLGLATVHGIIRQSSGHVTVASEEGSGTEFRIWLPASSAGDPQYAVEQRSELRTAGATGTVLLVEDESTVRAVVSEMLESSGFTVIGAADGAEALRLSAAYDGEIDLLVTDVVMPGMSGQEVARRIAEARPSTRTLFVSGYNAEAIQQHGVLAPGTEFLEKPFSMTDLAHKARALLAGSAAAGE